MELYHKIFKMNPDLTVYLDNPEQLVEHCDEMLSHLTGARSMDELHEEKIAVLRDFYSVCSFDIQDADFPEPIGHFDSENEKTALIRKKILLQDTGQYLGRVYKKYHIFLYNKNGNLPIIQLDNCVIDYNEIYIRAMEDYVDSIINKKRHSITASFALPTLIERGLGMNLQNRMLFKSIYRLLNMQELKRPLDDEEDKYIKIFLSNKDNNVLFSAKESYVMGKMYALFVSEGVLEPSMDNEMILTGVGHNKGRRLDRTLGALIKTDFAKKEIISEYMKIIDIIFCKLNIRNCIMHGLGEMFDYLNIGIVAVMFQLLWDVAACEIFND